MEYGMRACGVPGKRDVGCVAAKVGDVFECPLQGGPLIPEAGVGGVGRGGEVGGG
jgi:hypothetical protein